VSLGISGSIFALAIRLIDRLAVDLGSRRSSAPVMRIHIIDVDDQSRVRDIHRER
jgi:hypothetical protein